MALKQNIVVRSRFGAKAGRTPGRYVKRYTSRLDATEPLVPYNIHSGSLSDYVGDYMARAVASDDEIAKFSSYEQLETRNDVATPQSARMFGNRGISYSKKDMDQALPNMDQAVTKGHTFITTIVSFTHEYLQEQHVVPSNMPAPKHKGDYKGKVDQLKLRRAVMDGVTRMLKKMHFAKPEWVGTIQLDTKHVHAHLAIIETANDVPKERLVKRPVWEYHTDENGVLKRKQKRDFRGNLVYENLGERGVIKEDAKAVLRRGIDLDLKKTFASKALINEITAHRTLVKDKALNLSFENDRVATLVSQIYEALPKKVDGRADAEASLKAAQKNWRAQSRRKDMRLANKLSDQYVNTLLKRHSLSLGIPGFIHAVDKYADKKVKDDANKKNLKKQIKQSAMTRLRLQLVNQLYQRLKSVRLVKDANLQSELKLSQENAKISDDAKPFSQDIEYLTPVQTSNFGKLRQVSDEDLRDKIAYGFENDDQNTSMLTLEHRLRSYPERFSNALIQRDRYADLRDTYDKLAKSGQTSDDSKALRHMYDVEHQYNAGLVDKYSYLMNSVPPTDVDIAGVQTTLPVSDTGAAYKAWLDDNQELLKHPQYALDNDAEISELPPIHDLPEPFSRYLKDTYGEDHYITDLRQDPLAKYQATVLFEVADKTKAVVSQKQVSKERFDEVKAYDMLDMVYDIDRGYQRNVSQDSIDTFESMARTRQDALNGGLDYLRQSGQMKTKAYDWYVHDRVKVDEDLSFSKVLNQIKELPEPVPHYYQDTTDESELLLISKEDSLRVSKDSLVEQKLVVDQELSRVNELFEMPLGDYDVVKAITKDPADLASVQPPTEIEYSDNDYSDSESIDAEVDSGEHIVNPLVLDSDAAVFASSHGVIYATNQEPEHDDFEL